MHGNRLVHVNVYVDVGYERVASQQFQNCEPSDVPTVIREAFANAARALTNGKQLQQAMQQYGGGYYRLDLRGEVTINAAN